MASALYSEDLTCSVCLTFFTDPVTLPCGHSFCRGCITYLLSLQHQCPHCQTAVSIDTTCLPTSHILKSLTEKHKGAEKEHRHEKAEVVELCPEHEEKLKLFCITDQQLACIICRDGEKHEGHKFKPIKEAAASLRQDLEKGMEVLCDDILATESKANTQREEMTKNKEKSQQLKIQICRQFEEMHQFLRKREDEMKNELKHKEDGVFENMTKNLNAIKTVLSESKELHEKMTLVLNITDSERLLKSWTEVNNIMTPELPLRPRASDLQVVNTSLSMGPYESHLQFFMWKEMLQVIQPRAELLSLKTNADITVSDDGRSLFCNPKSNQDQSGYNSSFSQPSTFGPSPGVGGFKFSSGFGSPAATFGFGSQTTSSPRTNHTFSVNEFTSGQHYWEIDVGHRDFWELGIQDSFLKYDGQKYATCGQNITTELTYGGKPRKIGIYLNCSSKKLSFYDADNMTHMRTMISKHMSTPLSAYFNIRSRESDPNPLTVCWY